MNITIKQILKFGLIGGSNTIISLLIYYILLFFGVHYIISNVAGYAVSSIWGYIVNRNWVFRAKQVDILKSLVRYYIVYVMALLINICCMYMLVDLVELSEKAAPLVVLCITVPLNFTASKFWIYKR